MNGQGVGIMKDTELFGSWVRQRRKALDLTQRVLADLVGCSVATLKKIEAEQRRPSRQLAERLAASLQVPSSEHALFLARARSLVAYHDVPLEPESLAPMLSARSMRLPAERTVFIGRDDELGRIAAMLADPDCRLLTLTGPGGIGKSRLALRAAGQLSAETDVWWVPLADVASPELLAPAIVAHLPRSEAPAEHPEAALVSILAPRAGLLVLDNVEQLLTAAQNSEPSAVDLLLRLLDRCPRLKLLVTSRERLNVQAEWLLSLDGLPVDDVAPVLFAARARQVQPGFALEEHRHAVAEICYQLGGFPLAIELAASWTQTLSCAQIVQQIRQHPEALTSRLRDIPPRHRSLDGLFEHSWQLLSIDEQTLWRQLAVFHGGCFLEEGLAVCRADLSTLQALVDRSLVRADGEGRFQLHALAQHYVARKLDASGTAETTRRRHFEVYVALAEQVAMYAFGSEAEKWLRRLDGELGNLRAAWTWAIGAADVTSLYRLMRPSSIYWQARGHFHEGAGWMQQLLERTAGNQGAQYTEALIVYSNMRARSGHPREALPYLLDGYQRASDGDDPYLLGIAALNMSQAAPSPKQRLHYGRMAIAALRAADDQMHLGAMLWMLGDELRAQSELEQARDAYIESVNVLRRIGNTAAIIYPLGNLGRLTLLEGNVVAAQRSFAECVTLARRSGNSVALADWLLRLGVTNLYQGQLEEAREGLEEAHRLAQKMGHQQIVPNVWSWLALEAVLAGDIERASCALQQSLDGYRQLVALESAVPAPHTQHHDRPDLLDALIATAHVQAAKSRMKLAVLALSVAAQMQMAQGYRLEPPLQAMADNLGATIRAALGEQEFVRRWQQGRTMSVADLITELVELTARSHATTQLDKELQS